MTTPGGGQQPSQGQLTAGDWDDNLNFSFFLRYASEFVQANAGFPALPGVDRELLTVVGEDGAPLSGAQVLVGGPGGAGAELRAGTDGRVLLSPGLDGVRLEGSTVAVRSAEGVSAAEVSVTQEGGGWKLEAHGLHRAPPGALDVAFVVDATGSMSDELEYLKTELQGIADAVRLVAGNRSVRYALVVYRDSGDEYVTRTFDFTTDVQAFRGNLGQQSAGGGGDYPEAMQEAALKLNGLSWRPGNVARVAFLVADAPPHTSDAAHFLAEVNRSRLAGIRIYPMAASGAGDDAEYFLRGAAQLTGARYLFLTDDSGIGGTHQEPHIPCYQVQLMSKLLIRMIESELSGTRVSIAPEDVIRSVGNPTGGVCTLADGTQARF